MVVHGRTLLNVGINQAPTAPEYYSRFFETIIHICPGECPGLLRQVSHHEYIYNLASPIFNIIAIIESLSLLESTLFIEIALQSGISYPGLACPDDAVIIGRMCDLHHLDNPLTQALSLLQIAAFDCLVFSSCPHYITLFSSVLPCFYLPTDINLSQWILSDDIHQWLSRPIRLHLDGKLLSSLHPTRSYLFNALFAFYSDHIVLPDCEQRSHNDWLSRLGETQIVVQCGLNGNAHPPFLAAVAKGTIPLIDSLSSRTLSNILGVNLSHLTYRSPSHLAALLQVTPRYFYDCSSIAAISTSIRNLMQRNVSDWFSFLQSALHRSYGRPNLASPKHQFRSVSSISHCNDLQQNMVFLQALQELIRRCSYLSQGELPSLVLYKPETLSFGNLTDPRSLPHVCEYAFNLWPVQLGTRLLPDRIPCRSTSIDEALVVLASKLKGRPFCHLFQVDSNELTASIHVATPWT